MSELIRILQIPGKMDMGGVSAVIMNYYHHIDRNIVQFDFAVNRDCSFPQEQEIRKDGNKIYRVSSLKNVVAYVRDIYKIVKKEKYQIVHAHMNTLNVFPLMAAWMAGASVRICHNHSTASKEERIRWLVKIFFRLFAKIFPTHLAACSVSSAEWIYGKKYVAKHSVLIIPNGIEIEKFSFNQEVRDRIRKELGVEKKIVVGNVGRFVQQKNHTFLIDIFRQIYEERKDAVLLLIGEGNLLSEIQTKVIKNGLTDYVQFLGVRYDINELYQAMDIFLLPSLYEGFPVVTIEAQASGLPCVVSTAVPAEAVFSEYVKRLSLNEPVKVWSMAVNQGVKGFIERKQCNIKKYDIACNAKRLENTYKDMSINHPKV